MVMVVRNPLQHSIGNTFKDAKNTRKSILTLVRVSGTLLTSGTSIRRCRKKLWSTEYLLSSGQAQP